MSLNAIVNGTTYKDVSTIVVGDKSVVLEQVQESSDSISPWEGSLENAGSIGYILNACEKATATDTFEGGSTFSFDTGLGDDAACLVIVDESAKAFPTLNSNSIEGIYLFIFDTVAEDGIAIFSNGDRKVAGFNGTCFKRANHVSFTNGVFEYTPIYDNNVAYNNFTPGHRYRWFAW